MLPLSLDEEENECAPSGKSEGESRVGRALHQAWGMQNEVAL